jgi:hypothetical protein
MIDDTTAETGTGTSPRQRAIEAYESARDSVSGAGRRAADTFSEAPLIALAGGLAAGALIAALLPRTDSETRLVRPTARRVKDTARAAYNAARDTGSDRLNALGLNREKGEETIRSLLEGVTDAVKASGQAALDAARNKG